MRYNNFSIFLPLLIEAATGTMRVNCLFLAAPQGPMYSPDGMNIMHIIRMYKPFSFDRCSDLSGIEPVSWSQRLSVFAFDLFRVSIARFSPANIYHNNTRYVNHQTFDSARSRCSEWIAICASDSLVELSSKS